MNPSPPNGEEFVREVGRQAGRHRDAQRGSVWRGLAQVGSVGWMVALPAVGGGFLGRGIDRRFGTGTFWTLSLLSVGLAIGCVAAWRAMNRELQE